MSHLLLLALLLTVLSTDLMSHQELAGIGVPTELTGEEGSVIVIWIVSQFHGALAEAGESLAQGLAVSVVLVQTSHHRLGLLGFGSGVAAMKLLPCTLLL